MAQTAPVLNQTASATSSATIVVPAGVKVGDYMRIAAGGAATTTPAGWTQLFNDNNAGFAIYGKWAAVGDPGSTVSLTQAPSVIQFDSWTNVGADPIVVGSEGSSSGSNVSTLTVAAPQVTTADANCAVIETWFGLNQFSSSGVSLSVSSTATATQAATVYPTSGTPQDVEGLFSGYQAQTAAGLSTSESATFTWSQTGSSSPPASLYGVAMALPPIQAPAAPTLGSPANASYADLSGTPTFSWTYNATTNDGSQNAIAFRRKVSGASSYSYWDNGTSAWQSSEIWNSYASGSLTFPSGSWTDGNIYNWSVATQEATEGLQGPFASDFTVTAQVLPTISITAPTGTITTTSPTVAATATVASGAALLSYRVVVYTLAQTKASGFTPGGTPNVYDSGTVNQSSTTISQATSGLSNNVTYVPYVLVTETGGEESAWTAGTAFTVSADTPAQPSITATASTDGTTGCPLIALVVQGHDNLFSATDASFEGSVGTWTAGSNTTIADSTAQALDGIASMSMTATAAGDMSATSGSYTLNP